MQSYRYYMHAVVCRYYIHTIMMNKFAQRITESNGKSLLIGLFLAKKKKKKISTHSLWFSLLHTTKLIHSKYVSDINKKVHF